MRVLLLHDALPKVDLGGSERVVWETAVALRGLGHDVGIVTAAPPGILAPEEEGVRIFALPQCDRRWAHYRAVFSRRRAQEVISAIREFRPDVIHAHGLAWQIGYAWIGDALLRHTPRFYTAHGVMNVSYGKVTGSEPCLWWSDLQRARWMVNPLRNAIVRRLLAQCDTTFCVSNALRKYLARFGYRNLATLHNGIDVRFWKPESTQADARRSTGLPIDRVTFLLAGRVGHAKGAAAVMDALPSSAGLIIAGEADPAFFASLGDRVRYFPRQTPQQMKLLYAACDATLAPSVYLDPFPTVCLESQACERPVVATSHGGAQESVVDGVTGWVVDPLDTGKLRQLLTQLVSSPSQMMQAGSRGRSHIVEHFSLDGYCARLLQAYAAALDRRRAGVQGEKREG